MGKQGKKNSKDLRKEAQNIQIVVTSDHEIEEANNDGNNEPVPEIKVVKKKTSKSLAFDDKIEYSVEGDVFHQVMTIKYFLATLPTLNMRYIFGCKKCT